MLVATPARVVAALNDKLLPIFEGESSLEMLVLDEADLLLSYGANPPTPARVCHLHAREWCA